MNISEQLKLLERSRVERVSRMNVIAQKAMDEGRSMDEDEREQFDTCEREIADLDAEAVRLRKLEALNIQRAAPVDSAAGLSGAAASAARGAGAGGAAVITTRIRDEAFKGQFYTRMVIARAIAFAEQRQASAVAAQRWGKSDPLLVEVIRANEVSGGASVSGEWGAELVAADGRFTGDFIEFLYSQTVYNQLGLRDVPANVLIKGQDGAALGYWVGQAQPIPVSALDFSSVQLTPLKVAAIVVASVDLLRDSAPSAEQLIRDSLVAAAAQRIDLTFVSNTAAVAGVSPAGILVGATPIASAGDSGDGVRQDVKALYAPFISAKNAGDLTFIANKSLAKSLSLMTNALGQKEFPGLGANGGTLEGDRMVTGDNVNAAHLILCKPSDIWRIGAMGVEVSMSRDATIEMSSAPTGESLVPTAQSQQPVNMFQTENVAIKVVCPMNFQKRRAHAVQYINDAAYGTQSS